MKARHVVIIVCGALGGFFVGRMIPLILDSGDSARSVRSQAEGQERPALRTQLGKQGRPFKDYSWAEVFALADTAQESDDWIALLEEARHDSFLMRAIVRRWADQDAPGCWEHILTLGDGIMPPQHLAGIVAKAWGMQDPEAAVATLAGMASDGKSHVYQRAELSWIVVRAALAEDLDRGMALMPLPFSGGSFGWGKLEPWMAADPERACRALAALPHDCTFRNTVSQAALEWHRRDPAAALAWCQQASADLQRLAYKEISEGLIDAGDYEGARDVALLADSMSLRQSISLPYVSHLTKTDPLAACAWVVENFDGQMLGGALGNIVGNADFKAHAPEEFLPFFEQMPEGYGKGNSARRFVRRWMSTDGLAAVTWGESLDPRTRGDVMSSQTAKDWAKQAQAREWLKTAADTRFSQRTLEAIVAEINNPEKAREWGASLPPDRAAQVEEALVKLAQP